MRPPTERGFTLIELMIVVAIIGILAAIAIPKFADLIRKSNEGSTKGNLGRLKSAISIYYADMEGQYPGDFTSLTINGKYLANIPKAKTPNYHSDKSSVKGGSDFIDIDDTGGWIYANDPTNESYGEMHINCAHTDTKGEAWASY